MTTPYVPSRWMVVAADSNDDPDVFPFLPGQSFLQLKASVWSTKIDTAVSGRERRRALWSYPIWKFKVGYEVLRDAPSRLEIQKLYAFFNTHQGSARDFLYLDRTDSVVSGMKFGTGDGTTTAFQLSSTATVGGITYTQPVLALNGTPTIFVNGTVTTAFAVSDIGLVTFTTAPAASAVLSWTGSYFYRCRFASDEMDAEQMMQGLWAMQGLEFQSFKL